MFKNEDEFKEIVSRLEIDDKPNTAHRKKLRLQMLSAFNEAQKAPSHIRSWQTLGRTIMKSKITKLAAAAVIISAVSLLVWLSTHQDYSNGAKSISYFSLLSEVRAAEQNLFYQDGISHIVNEIVVYQTPEEILPEDEEQTEIQKGIDTAHSFLEYNWLPMCSVQANGQLRFNQLQLSSDETQPYTIVDESWYDPAGGKFARVLKVDEQVFFANSYDGQFVYSSQTAPDGSIQLIKEQAADSFTPPQNPAEFLGITAGMPSDISEESGAPIQEIQEGALADGTPVRIVTAGFTDMFGDLKAYWMFKIRRDDNIVAEMEFVIDGNTQFLIRRVAQEIVDAPDISWHLDMLPQEVNEEQEEPKAKVQTDMVIPDVSIQHMVERAGFETYLFSTNPPWTNYREIVDCIDPPSPGHRMFFIAYRADDGRHLVLVQSPTYNKMLGKFTKSGQLVYTSPNGFKVWGGGPQKWYSQILLSSARSVIKDPPSEDRIGFVLESPAGTFPALAVNGPLTDEELHNLIDSLIPAKEYQQD